VVWGQRTRVFTKPQPEKGETGGQGGREKSRQASHEDMRSTEKTGGVGRWEDSKHRSGNKDL